MRKRVFFIILMGIFMILILVGYPHLDPKYKPAQNIFDEMYSANVDKTAPAYYRGKFKVNVKTPRAFDEDMNEQRRLLDTHITYHNKALPKGYQSVSVHFYGYYRYMDIRLYKKLDHGLMIAEYIVYHPDSKRLEKQIRLVKTSGENEDFIDDDTHIKQYLKEYGIGKKDLDHYYDEIVYDFVLKDWLTNYDSKYTTNDYGEFTTKTQWENW